jgi:hypothetical protein
VQSSIIQKVFSSIFYCSNSRFCEFNQ